MVNTKSKNKNIKKVRGGSAGTDYQILLMSVLICFLVIFILLPQLAGPKYTDLFVNQLPDDLQILVPNRIVKTGTDIKRYKSGHHTTVKSQDLDKDDMVLTTRLYITDQDHKVRTLGVNTSGNEDNDIIPCSSDMEDPLHMTKINCISKCEESEFGIVMCS